MIRRLGRLSCAVELDVSFLQGLVQALAIGDVGQHHAMQRRALGVARNGRLQMRPEAGALMRAHPQLAGLRLPGRQQLLVIQVVDVLVRFQHEAAEGLVDQRAARQAEQGGRG